MKQFIHFSPKSISEAVSILNEYGDKARILAGGTDLLGVMKNEILPYYPKVLVNLKSIPNLEFIEKESNSLRIGPLTKLSDIAANTHIRSTCVVLSEAAHRVGIPQIRNMGTIAGNISQMVRCWYYRVPRNYFPCLRKGGRTCYAIAGNNKYHSIFGPVQACVAVNPGDVAPALVVLDARIITSKRILGINEFFALKDENSTVLDSNEIITEIQIPISKNNTRSAYLKYAIRETIDFPIVNCAAAVTVDRGLVKSAKICLNAVYNKPWQAIDAERYIEGKAICYTTTEEAGSAAVSKVQCLPKNKYKAQIAKTLVKRAILACGSEVC